MPQKLNVSSLRSIGVVNPRLQVVELEDIQNKEALIDQYVRMFVARRRACTLFELEEMIVKMEEVDSFADLKMGFLSFNEVARKYFFGSEAKLAPGFVPP